MRTKAFWALLGLAVLLLGACGPIIGGFMVAGNGIKEFRVTSGSLATLRPGAKLAIIGPFNKTPEAFYICRGEDDAYFASSFKQNGLFAAELTIPDRFPKQYPKATDWHGKTPAEVQQALNLSAAPDYLMSGTILRRDLDAAPTQGVIMKVAFRLDFLELATGKTTTVEVDVQELFQDAIPAIAKEFGRQMGRR
ncbi:MAG: hypothetical protein NDI73_13100 [Desulfuromonadales bacterium]|nr:hypothetical protein [Desulfuromonadales bacterium]